MQSSDSDIELSVPPDEGKGVADNCTEATEPESTDSRVSDVSEDGGEENNFENNPTYLTDVLDKVATPIPRVDMHLRRVRSPDYFRTQYLSNLGIWTNDHANQMPDGPTGTEVLRYVPSGTG